MMVACSTMRLFDHQSIISPCFACIMILLLRYCVDGHSGQLTVLPKAETHCDHHSTNIAEEFSSPFPVEVTSDILDCFEEEYILQQLGANQQWLGKIGDIGEELWVYSKTREILGDESDRQYLSESLATVKTKIEKMLGLLGTSVDSKTESLITDLRSEVS